MIWNSGQEITKREEQKKNIMKDIIEELYDVVNLYHDYSVLGHMDLIKRYDDHDGYDSFNNHKK